jgi:hypothetical protein
MAQAKTKSGTDAGSMTEKTVTVIAYAANDAFKSERAMADALDQSRDYYERDYQRSRTVSLALDRDGDEYTEQVWNSDLADALLEGGVDHGDVSVVEDVEVSRPYAHSPRRAVKQARDSIVADLPDELSSGLTRGLWGYKWQDDDAVTKVSVDARNVDYRRVLVHRSERGGRRKYDSERKHLSMQFNITLGEATEAKIESWTDEVVKPFIEHLYDLSWVERVRVTDCVEHVEREGDCFDAL